MVLYWIIKKNKQLKLKIKINWLLSTWLSLWLGVNITSKFYVGWILIQGKTEGYYTLRIRNKDANKVKLLNYEMNS